MILSKDYYKTLRKNYNFRVMFIKFMQDFLETIAEFLANFMMAIVPFKSLSRYYIVDSKKLTTQQQEELEDFLISENIW